MTQSNPWGGSTEYNIVSGYYLADNQSYSQFVTLAPGSSTIDINIATPTGTEYLSTTLTNAGQLYTLSSVNVFTSIEFYNNNDSGATIYIDMANLLTSAATLSANGLVLKSLTYYYFSKPIVSNQIKLVTDTNNVDVRIIRHFA